jgi:hypothetical protein
MTQPVRPAGNDFLMGAGGPPAISWKGAVAGTTIRGQVLSPPETVQQTEYKTNRPMFWDNDPTRPMWQGVVSLGGPVTKDGRAMIDPTDRDDQGDRRLFFKGQLQKAIKEAVLAAGASGLEPGGWLTVTKVGTEPTEPGSSDERNLFSASFVRPAGGAALGITPAEAQAAASQSFTQAAGQPAPAAQPVAQPAAQAVGAVGPDGTRVDAPPGVDAATYAAQPAAVKAAMWNVANGGMVATG